MKKRKVLSLLLAGVVAMSSVVPVLGATTQEKIEAAQVLSTTHGQLTLTLAIRN